MKMICPLTVKYAAFLLLPAALVSAVAPKAMFHRNLVGVNGTTTSSSSTSTSSIDTSSITPYPTLSRPYCWVPETITTEYCRVSVGTVQLHFWPTGVATMNRTYPSVVTLTEYDLTMTSPSVYYVINEMKATDYCGNLIGPVLTNFVTGYDISQVSTLPPFLNSWDDARIGPPTQLYLSDLRTDCATSYTIPINNHNLVGDVYDSACNPVLEYGTALKNGAAGGAWASCGRYWGGKLGIFDPPIPVTPCGANDCGNAGAGPAPTPPPVNLPTTAIENQSPTTAAPPSPPPAPPALPTNTAPPNNPPANDPPPSNPPPNNPPPNNPPPNNPPNDPPPNSPPANNPPAKDPPAKDPPVNIPPPNNPPPNNPPENKPTPPTVPLPSPNQVPNTPPSPPKPTPPTPIAIGTIPGAITSIAGKPTTIAGSEVTISAIPGKPHAVIVGSQTISLGGPALTLPSIIGGGGGAVVTLAPSGVVVVNSNNNNDENGATQTFLLPPNPPPEAPIPQSLGVVVDQVISAIAIGSSQAVVGSHTLSVGGPVATLAGDQVVSLGSAGLVVQAPSGVVTVLSVPSPIPAVEDVPVRSTSSSSSTSSPETTTSRSPTVAGGGSSVSTTQSVTSTGVGGVIYNTFQGSGSRQSYFGFLGSMLGLVFSVVYVVR